MRVLDIAALVVVGVAALGMSIGVFRDQNLVVRLIEIGAAFALDAWFVTLVIKVRFLWTENRAATATAD